uniref:Class I SAM-dependent methyltransferase n=1 Tax=Bosea sp. NBC_00436 TaxID=2969620 RepID=A0A9E7ZVM2_9HYPH
MGINREFVATMLDLRRAGMLKDHATVIELGAQDISADPRAVAGMLAAEKLGSAAEPVPLASDLYRRLGYVSYAAIDANGLHGAKVFDLNRDLKDAYGFADTFDLVTNLGTLEHCFDQAAAFRNMHRLCKPGGLMIHCLPTQGLVNHAFYNYHPRFVADLSAANGYEIERIFFTADFKPEMVRYSIAAFKERDDRDLLIYAVLRKTSAADFQMPFDGMFSDESHIEYANRVSRAEIFASDFAAYIKTSWCNIRADAPLPPDGKRSLFRALFGRT